MRTLLLMVGLISACATLDQSKMSDSCRSLYNACLNSCPQADGRSRSAPAVSSGPTYDALAGNGSTNGNGNNSQWQMSIASCTDKCNQDAKDCR